MKNFTLFLLFTFLFFCNSWGQVDTVFIENTFEYKIVDGKPTAIKQIKEQNTYNLHGNLLWHVIFKDSLMIIKEYTAYIYDKEFLVSIETFTSNDSISKIKRYNYTSDGKVSNEYIYKRLTEGIELSERSSYYYTGAVLVKKETFNRKKKWLKKTNYTYTENEKIKYTQFRKKYRDDNLKSQQKIFHLKNGIIQSSETKKLYYTDKIDIIEVEYQYNQKTNKIIQETWKNKSDSIFKIVKYNYTGSENNKTGKSIVDGNGIYLDNKGYERSKRAVIWKNAKMYDLKTN